MFNGIRPDSSRKNFSSFKAILQTCLLVLTSLVLTLPQAKSENLSAATEEQDVLVRTLRGFVSIAYPDGDTNRCSVRQASDFILHQRDSYRNWYHLALESHCPGEVIEMNTIWIVCANRSTVVCSVIASPPKSLD